MTLVDHNMKKMETTSFKEFSVKNKDVCIYTPNQYGYNNLNFMFLTFLSNPKDTESKVTYTAIEYLISVPNNSATKQAFVNEYTTYGADAMLTLLEQKLKEENFTGNHKYYTSVQAFVNDSTLWNKTTGLQFRIIANIHDVENVGSVADFYTMFVDPLARVFDLEVTDS